jgi:hypothetical protein
MDGDRQTSVDKQNQTDGFGQTKSNEENWTLDEIGCQMEVDRSN